MQELTVDLTQAQLETLLDDDTESLRVPVSDSGPDSMPLAEVRMGDTVALAGIVRTMDDVNTFEQDDGEQGKVRGIRLQDASGDLRVALWGDHAEKNLSVGDYVYLTDIEIQDGWQDDIEGSCGWGSSITVLDEPEDEIEYVNIRLKPEDDDDDS